MKKSIKTFDQLPIERDIAETLAKHKITNPTEIQDKCIPHAMEGRDMIGRSKTGSGKTLAFAIPIVQEMREKPGRGVKALVLTPTRELAKQVEEETNMINPDGRLKTTSIYGGVDYEPQFKALKEADIVVGTPGRVLDHMQRGTLNVSEIEFFVLDEADRMLDMGFIDDIRRVISKTPFHKQSFFFSATMPHEARELAESFMRDPLMVATQEVYVDNRLLEEFYVDCDAVKKVDMLAHIIKMQKPRLGLVFVNSRLFTDKVAEYLSKQGINAEALHGGHAQNKREKLVKHFEEQKINILVATDVAARGLDIDDISHVYNYEVPKEAQTYTHRIGRTARAGKKGVALTLLDREEHRIFSRIEGDSLRDIKKMRVEYHPKKTYFLPRREGTRHEGPRRGPPRREGPRRGPPHRDNQRRRSRRSGPPRKNGHHRGGRPPRKKRPFMPKH